jgi:hypothetical protein
MSNKNGKGDSPRPYDANKFAENFSKIKWRNEPDWKRKIITKPIKKCDEK